MKKYIVVSILLLVSLTGIMTGCGRVAAVPEVYPTVQFTDSCGRTVEVPCEITRIAASGSLAQIMLWAIAPEMLVGVANQWSKGAAEFIDPQYRDLPVLGQFYGSGDLNLEEIAAVKPQIIIDLGEAKSTIVADMDSISGQVDIPAVHITANIENTAEAFRSLGKLLGLEERAEVLADYCSGIYARTVEIMQWVGTDNRTSLVYCMGDDGLNVTARGSYHAQVIDLVSDNLAVIENPTAKGTGTAVDIEQLLNWDPQVIIFAADSVFDSAADDPAWRNLKAISEGNYYEVPRYPYNWMGFPPSVNRYMGMIWLTQLLYPDTAGFDCYAETARYYELFYHYDLSQERYNQLIANSLPE